MTHQIERRESSEPGPADDAYALQVFKFHMGNRTNPNSLDAWAQVYDEFENIVLTNTSGVARISRVGRVIRRIQDLLGTTSRKRRFEATHLLGTEPSTASSTGWSVSHPLMSKGVEYQLTGSGLYTPKEPIDISEVQTVQTIRTDEEGKVIDQNKETQDYSEDTGMRASLYIDSQGNRRVVLGIWNVKGRKRWDDILVDQLIEKRLLMNKPTDKVDSRMVVFEKPGRKKHIIQIKAAEQADIFQVSRYRLVSN